MELQFSVCGAGMRNCSYSVTAALSVLLAPTILLWLYGSYDIQTRGDEIQHFLLAATWPPFVEISGRSEPAHMQCGLSAAVGSRRQCHNATCRVRSGPVLKS